jgi:D-inositol-3-phosphate glycosyltransferase
VTHWGRVRRWLPDGSDPDRDRALGERIRRLTEDVTLVAIGAAQADELTAAGLPPAATIPPGVELTDFRPGDRGAARRQLGLAADERLVLYVGRLSHDKNVATLIRAFARPERPAGTRLLLIGDGPLRAELQHLADELCGGAATFLPFVRHRELPLYYQAVDVTVVPSDRLETFCMVALEAIACSCPLVVTDQAPEILRSFPTVPWVEPHDVDGLSARIAEALDGRVPPADPRRAADFDWSAVASRYLPLYRAALRTRP